MANLELQPGERLVLKCRRHWIYLWPALALDALIVIVPVALLAWMIGRFDWQGGVRSAVFVLMALWTVAWAVHAYFIWYRHHNDMWLITNQRLIDSQRKHWFHQELASADLVDVQDTSIQRNGVLRTMLNYGDLLCQTAGQQLNFILNGIPAPTSVLTTLDRTRDEARRSEREP